VSKRMLFVIPIALATLLLAGCEMLINTSVKADGSGILTVEFGYTAREERLIVTEGIGEDSSSSLCELFKEDPGIDLLEEFNATITEERRGSQTWCVTRISFANLDELAYIYPQTDNAEAQTLDINADGEFTYLVNIHNMEGAKDEYEALGIPYTITWKLTVPGAVGENNADKVNGRTLTWDLELEQDYSLYAESFPSNSTPWLILGGVGLCLCLLALVIIGVVIIVIAWRKKR